MFDFFRYRYVSVSFSPTSQVYLYRTDSCFLRAGDVVIVPTPRGQMPALVLGAEDYSRREAPYPVSKTARLIEKADRHLRQQFLEEYKTLTRALPRSRRFRDLKPSCWIKIDRFWADPCYKCGFCGETFRTAPPACPCCHSDMRRTKYDPAWVDALDELEYY